MEKNIVIIGNGAAGYYAAEAARRKDGRCSIAMISDEKYISYYRPRLSHYLGENELGNKFFLREESWYLENGIELLLDNEVSKIDSERKTVQTSKGINLTYDMLIVANGGRSFVPGIKGNDKKGVFTLKTLEDAISIKEWMKKSQKAVVIGGGLLGLEAAWAMKKYGLDVSVNNTSDRLMSNQLCSESGKFLARLVNEKGVEILLNDTAVSIDGDDAVRSVTFESGKEIEADMVLFSAGIRADIGFAKAAGIECERGIVVDSGMNTNIDGIYACGDVVQLGGRGFGNWVNAMHMGKTAGVNAVGENMKFVPGIQTVMLNSFDTNVGCIGNTQPPDDERSESVVEGGGGKFKKLFFRSGKLVGGVVIGDPQSYAKVMSDISQGREISEFRK